MLFSQQWFDGAEKRCGTSVTSENTDRQVMSAHVKGAVVNLYFYIRRRSAICVREVNEFGKQHRFNGKEYTKDKIKILKIFVKKC